MTLNKIEFDKIYADIIAPEKTANEILTELWQKYEAETGEVFQASNPAAKVLEVLAFADWINDDNLKTATKEVLPSFAKDEFLDEVLGWFHLGKRHIIVEADEEADPPIAEALEDDKAFKTRIMEEYIGQSHAGPAARYLALAKRLSDVKDVYVKSPQTEEEAGELDIYILTHIANGVAAAQILIDIQAVYNQPNGVNDSKRRTLHSATINEFALGAEVTLKSGPDPVQVKAILEQQLQTYLFNRHMFENYITKSGILAALTIEGVVDNVTITNAHGGNIACLYNEVAFCTTPITDIISII